MPAHVQKKSQIFFESHLDFFWGGGLGLTGPPPGTSQKLGKRLGLLVNLGWAVVLAIERAAPPARLYSRRAARAPRLAPPATLVRLTRAGGE